MRNRILQSLPDDDDEFVTVGQVRKLLADAEVAARRQAAVDMWVQISDLINPEEGTWSRSTHSRISGPGPTQRDSGA